MSGCTGPSAARGSGTISRKTGAKGCVGAEFAGFGGVSPGVVSGEIEVFPAPQRGVPRTPCCGGWADAAWLRSCLQPVRLQTSCVQLCNQIRLDLVSFRFSSGTKKGLILAEVEPRMVTFLFATKLVANKLRSTLQPATFGSSCNLVRFRNAVSCE